MPKSEKFSGSFSIEIGNEIIESNTVFLAQTAREERDIRVDLILPAPFEATYTTRETLSASPSLIKELSNANYPRSSAELVPKIVEGFIEKEESELVEIKTDTRDRVADMVKNRIRSATAYGFASSSLVGLTIVLAAERSSWGWATGWSAVVVGGIALSECFADNSDIVDEANYENIDAKKERLTVLKLVQSASRKQQIENI